ncbi:DNA primase [Thermosulfuriphilus sp.]
MNSGFSEAIREIKATANIVDVISEHVSLRKRGRNYVGLCPFHAEKTPSFTVSEERQAFHCFGCGVGGDVFTFLMKFLNLSFAEAAQELARRYGIRLPDKESPKKAALRDKILSLNERTAAYYHQILKNSPEGAPGRTYLADRGLDEETIERFRLGFAPQGWDALVQVLRAAGVDLELAGQAGLVAQRSGRWYDRFRQRIIFPIRDLSGRVVGFGGRILGQGDPKYLNTPETLVYHKGRLLYGLYEARLRIREEGLGFIVEGYFDLLSLSKAGVANVVATLGTALTRDHVRLLKGYAKDWYLVFDGDSAGLKAVLRAAPIFLNENLFPRVVVLPEGEDPDSFVLRQGQEGFLELASQAQEIFPFLVDMALKAHRDRGRAEARAAVVEELRPVLQALIDPIKQASYIEELAERLSLRPALIYRSLENGGPLKSEPSQRPLEGDPFSRSLMAFLVHHPRYIHDFLDLAPEEFLKGDYLELYKALKALSAQGSLSSEDVLFEDENLSRLWADLILAEELDDQVDPRKMAQELKDCLRRLRNKQRQRELLEEIRRAQKEGHQELAVQLLKQYQGLCLQQAG